MERKPRVYRRRELYEQVWAEPLTKIAPRYGVSNVALGKMCRRLGIPLPGVGYWTKVACGRQPGRPPLPPATAEQPEELLVEVPEYPRPPSLAVGDVPRVTVSDHLRKPHGLVVRTKTLADEGAKDRFAKDNDGRLCVRRRGGLDVLVGPASLGRALRMMDALLKCLERRGYEVGVAKERPFSTFVVIQDERVAFQVREGVVRRRREPTTKDPHHYPAFDGEPTGQFTLEIKERINGLRKIWTDGKEQRIEDQLGTFIQSLERAGDCLRERHERFLERAREREAEEIRRQELEAQRREEKRKVDELMDEVASWRKSEDMRAYVAAVRVSYTTAHGPIEEGSELDDWMRWALDVADRLDPLKAS